MREVSGFEVMVQRDLASFRQRVGVAVRGATSLESAAQALAGLLFEAVAGEVALARVYVSQPFERLPADERRAAEIAAAASSSQLEPGTRVLCLLGSRGVEPAWNDRRQSRDHRAIPLIDARHVEEIPMIAKLLTELGCDLAELDDKVRGVFTRRLAGGFNGVFHVADAATAVDARDRHVIPAQDFVARHGIRTVFGMGGAFVDGTLVTMIAFCRREIDRDAVQRLATVVSTFKSATNELVWSQRIFADA
jgi:hypothetical protein